MHNHGPAPHTGKTVDDQPGAWTVAFPLTRNRLLAPVRRLGSDPLVAHLLVMQVRIVASRLEA